MQMIDLHSKISFLANSRFRRASVIFFFSVQTAVVVLLAHWGIHVVLEGSVCAVVTMLGLDVTSVLQDITAIPTAGVSKSLPSFYWSSPSCFCNTEENKSQLYVHLKDFHFDGTGTLRKCLSVP